jgi:RNA polymerase sigma factor (sigma-70 family)
VVEARVAELVSAARDGDLGAFGELVGRFQDMAYAAAFARLGDHHRAQDVAQEAFLIAFTDLGRLREPAAFPGWFRQIVLRQCGRQTRTREETVPLARAVGMEAPAPDPAGEAEAGEVAATVRAAILALPEHERLATALYYVGDYSQAEVAAFLGVPVTTVKKRLFAARRRLREGMLGSMEDAVKRQRPSRDDRFAATVQVLAAARRGDAAVLAQLLDRDPRLLDVREGDQPLLYVAAMHGYSGRTTGHRAAVEVLLARGAGRDVFAAAYLDDPDRAGALLAADPGQATAVDGAGMTALHHAAERGATEVARRLVAAGADPNARDGRGQTPLDHASHAGPWKAGPAQDMIRLLLDHGATVDVFQAAALGDTGRLTALLEADPRLVDARDGRGATPLYHAAHNLHLGAVELLLERGADVQLSPARGESPVATAIAHSWDAGGPQVVDRLRAAGATLTLRDACAVGDVARVRQLLAEAPQRLHERTWGETPLHIAARFGQIGVAEALLAAGHDPRPQDDRGHTPAQLAALFGQTETATWLEAQEPGAGGR